MDSIPTNKDARTAGLIYLLMIVTSGIPYGIWRYLTEGDAAAILDRIQSNQNLFSTAIVLGAIGFVFWLINGFFLYRLFKQYSHIAAGLMLTFVGVGATLALAGVARQVDALSLIRGVEGLPAINSDALQLQTMLAVRGYDHLFWISAIFSGLWLIPLGWLVFRCGFLPKILGVMLLLGSVMYLATLPGMVFNPGYATSFIASVIGITSGIPSVIGEMGTCLWLLIRGVGIKESVLTRRSSSVEPCAPCPQQSWRL
jgi:hypothetical protein